MRTLSFHFISVPEPDLLRQKNLESTFSHNIVHKLSNLRGEALSTADQIDLFHNFLHKLSLLVISLPLAVHLDGKN